MKKRLLLFLVIFSFLCSGCAVNDKDDIYKTVSGYLDALHNGDLTAAQSYCDKSYNDALGIDSFASNLDAKLREIDLGEDFNKDAKQFIIDVTKKSIQSYEIKNYKQDGDSATVTVDITGIDLADVNMTQAQQNAMQEYSQYMTDHFAELNETLNNEGEEAMKSILVKELSSMLFKNLNTEMDNTKPKDRTVDFYVKKIDGKWMIATES
ncbi:MAG: DUF4878 domain-containing protein [Faecalicoccus sp.]|nr:DUF4878 domain-containing protein [Faecalicoccus sp.]